MHAKSLVLCALVSVPVLAGCHDGATLPEGPPQPAFSVLNPGVTGTRTSTGYFYPTGDASFPFTCGTWLGRDSPNGCYFTDKYHIGFDMMRNIGDSVYAISRGDVIYRDNSSGSWG